ncbi:MAG: metal ABC transporter ATP-binding protein [Candidatus Saccharimonadales bacterium]
MSHSSNAREIIGLTDACLSLGDRILWQNLNLSINAGEFIAVLGPNGAGKTSFLQVLLGLLKLTSGSVLVSGEKLKRGSDRIGYIPQQKSFDTFLPVRGRDIVELGMNGHRFGLAGNRKKIAKRVNSAISSVGAAQTADKPIGLLSGGEQQRLRIAQALVSQPDLLLCDEPLLSLDLASQNTVTELINGYRHKHNAAVIFVTHEINPILPMVDRVLYIANGKWTVDTPENVLRSDVLTKLYGTPIEVLRLKDKLLVLGADEEPNAHHGRHN